MPRRRAAQTIAPALVATEEPAPVLLIPYETTEAAVRAALEAVKADGHITSDPQVIRIEPLA